MGPGSLRRAIERKSPMLLHRSIRTGSSIFANYSVTGRSLAHGLSPLKRREKRPVARCGIFRAKQWREPLDPLSNLINWCRRERESLQMRREMLLSGKFQIRAVKENQRIIRRQK